MPLYEYECDSCGHRFEVIQKYSDPHVEVCPNCGGHVQKLLSSPAIQFKGSGFYITDYARAGKAGTEGSHGSSAKSESAEDGNNQKKSETGRDSKPESKSEKSDKKDSTKSESGAESKTEAKKPTPSASKAPGA